MSHLIPAQEWWSADAIAASGLPGMPASRQGVEALVRREAWREKAGMARRRAGRGGGWEYSWRLFGQEARRQLLQARPQGGMAAKPRDRTEAWSWFDGLPQAIKDKAAARLQVLREVEKLAQIGMSRVRAVALVAAASQGAAGTVSEKTLWNWFALVDGIRPDDWLAYLPPRHHGAARPDAHAECSPEFFERLKTLYLRLEGPSFTASHAIAVKVAAAKGWQVLCERTARRRLDEQVPRVSQVFAREGLRGLERCFPPQTRDRSGMVAMEGVNADCHKFDVFVLWPEVEKPMRPQLVAFQDLYSNKILAWRVDRDPNKVAVMSAFGELVETYGIPKHCLFDNGHEFANKWLTGGAKSRFRFTIREDDPLGVLPQMGIELHWATPAHGQAKPIERAFRDLADRVAKDPRFAGAYVGNRPDAKPENYASRAIPLADFMRVVAQGILEHNARQGRVNDTARGRSFDDTFAASYATDRISKATAEQRRLWLMGQEVLTLHKGHGQARLHGAEYWSDWMNEFAGQKVIARFDPEDLNAGLYVYSLAGAFMGFAETKQKTPFFDLVAAKDHSRDKATRRRVERKLLAEYRTVPLDQVAAELDAIDAPTPMPLEAKVVELARRATGPLIERPQPVIAASDDQDSRHSAFVLKFEGAGRAKAGAEETARDRFHWALEMERAAERGEALTDQQYQRLTTYQATTEYQSEKAVWRTFGDAIFG